MGEHAVLPDDERARLRELARAVVESIDNDEDTVAPLVWGSQGALSFLPSAYAAELRRNLELLCIELVALADERDAVAREFRGVRDA